MSVAFKFHTFTMAAALVVAVMASCSSGDSGQDYNPLIDDGQKEDTSQQQQPSQTNRYEQYRPQVHYTPAQNWMNDPNGLVYADGVYHLFYQYNPSGNDWGNMSWGHATSTDLIHWQEQAVALSPDQLGMIFSGSAVIDKTNTSGFGANAMVAVYTSADAVQQQSIAFSTDGGKNFTKYEGNPVIRNNDDNLRDPKVFWHEESRQWIMTLAKGWKMGTEFYGSSDLKTWYHLSTFSYSLPGRPSVQWECPDLLCFDYQGHQKWVLLVSVNPGGPILGSGTMYFVGDFDGKIFTPDALDYPLWLDYGMDNYAGVTWSNTGQRKILIGWMNNWQYSGQVPCTPWRSAFTLPRELELIEHEGKPLLASHVVKEIDGISGEWYQPGETLDIKDAYQLRLTINLDRNTTITLSNSAEEQYVMDVNATERTITAHRSAVTGNTSFNGAFSVPSIHAPLNTNEATVTLDVFVDQSSVEIFTGNGSMSMTNLVFPQSLYNRLKVKGAEYQVQVRALRRIWD